MYTSQYRSIGYRSLDRFQVLDSSQTLDRSCGYSLDRSLGHSLDRFSDCTKSSLERVVVAHNLVDTSHLSESPLCASAAVYSMGSTAVHSGSFVGYGGAGYGGFASCGVREYGVNAGAVCSPFAKVSARS